MEDMGKKRSFCSTLPDGRTSAHDAGDETSRKRAHNDARIDSADTLVAPRAPTSGHDLPLETVDAILSLLPDSKDFDACIASRLFRVDTRVLRIRRRLVGVHKRLLLDVGDLEALEYLYERRRCRFTSHDVCMAASRDRFDMLRWLWDKADMGTAKGIRSAAARTSNLEMLQWICLRLRPSDARVDRLIEIAAQWERAPTVRWLCEHFGRPGTAQALFGAVHTGDRALVDYLHARCPANARSLYDRYQDTCHVLCEGAQGEATFQRLQHTCRGLIDVACQCGHYDLVKHMWAQNVGLYTHNILYCAVDGGDVRLVDFVWTHRRAIEARVHPWNLVDPPHIKHGPVSHQRLLELALDAGHVSLLLSLNYLFDVRFTQETMVAAAARGHDAIVDLLHNAFSIEPTQAVLVEACRMGHVAVVKRLLNHDGMVCDVATIDRAMAGGHAAVIEMIHASTNKTCSSVGIRDAVRNGHLDALFQVSHAALSSVHGLVDEALTFGHVSMLRYLVGQLKVPVANAEALMKRAVVERGIDVVRYLHEEAHVALLPKHVYCAARSAGKKVARYAAERTSCSDPYVDRAFREAIRRGDIVLARLLSPHVVGVPTGAAVDHDGVAADASADAQDAYVVHELVPECGRKALAGKSLAQKTRVVGATLDGLVEMVSDRIDWARSHLDVHAIRRGSVPILEWLHGRGLLVPHAEWMLAISSAIECDHRRAVEWLLAHGFRASFSSQPPNITNSAADAVRAFMFLPPS